MSAVVEVIEDRRPFLICPNCDAPQDPPLDYPMMCNDCERQNREAWDKMRAES